MKPLKILFANVPYDGHFNPLTGLAMHLKEKGHDVRWYAGSYYTEKLKKLGLHHYPFKKALDLNQYNLNEVFPERVAIKSQVKRLKYDMRTSFILRAPEYFEDIKEIDRDFNFDVMIADVAFTAIPLVKELLRKVVFSIGVMPLVENSKDLAPAGLGMEPSNSFWGRRKQDVFRYLTNKVLFGEENKLIIQLFREQGLITSGNIFDMVCEHSTLMLQIGTPGFEYKRSDLSDNIRFIGSLLPYSNTKYRPYAFSEEYNSYSKVVLVTQGTIEKDPEKIIIPTLEAFKGSYVLVVATTGGSKTEELRERFPHHNIIIEDFIPFNDVMPHVDVYITNGGYGGVMLGIENNLPMVVAGIHEGKNEINARIGYFRLGVNLKTERPSSEQIRKSVEEVLKNPEYRANVQALNAEFKQYNAYELCESYLQEFFGEEKEIALPAFRSIEDSIAI